MTTALAEDEHSGSLPHCPPVTRNLAPHYSIVLLPVPPGNRWIALAPVVVVRLRLDAVLGITFTQRCRNCNMHAATTTKFEVWGIYGRTFAVRCTPGMGSVSSNIQRVLTNHWKVSTACFIFLSLKLPHGELQHSTGTPVPASSQVQSGSWRTARDLNSTLCTPDLKSFFLMHNQTMNIFIKSITDAVIAVV